MSTALLPADARQGIRRLDSRPVGALDAVHDHVLRLLGDAEEATSVLADVALRAADRAAHAPEATSHVALLRAAHARLDPRTRRRPGPELTAELAGPEPGAGTLVAAMAVPSLRGAALLDLTARHGIELAEAATIVGLDRATAGRARTEALRQVRAHITGAGVGLDVDVPTALARLPQVGAPDPLHGLLATGTGEGGRTATHPALAWAATAVIIIATVAGVAAALPRLTTVDDLAAPVVAARAVTDGPAARQLATPGDDVPADGVEQLVVRTPEQGEEQVSVGVDEPSGEQDGDASTDDAATDQEQPSSEPSAEPESTPSPEPSPTPSPEPGDSPLGLDLLDP